MQIENFKNLVKTMIVKQGFSVYVDRKGPDIFQIYR